MQRGDFVFMLSEGDVFLHEDVLLHWSAQMAKSGAKMMMARYIRQDGGTAAFADGRSDQAYEADGCGPFVL